MTWQPFDFRSPRETTEVEPLQVQCVAERVFADPATTTARRTAVERATMNQASGCTTVVLNRQRVDQLLETLETLDKGLCDEHTTGVPKVRSAVTHQALAVATKSGPRLQEAWRLIQRVGLNRPAVEEREVLDLRTIFSTRRAGRE